MVKNGFTKVDIEEMEQVEMTAYLNLIIDPADKKPDDLSSGEVKKWVSTKRKNGGKYNPST